ncbi:MAG: hypothetical protein AAGC65_14685 [Mucilaginibacter sp.]|uniref:hypothetical protein n=1 Tax=Mucilaginibacter sp. TaxID=1882438 RepID=UPI0031B42BC8
MATKVTKKAFSRKASLPHMAFALQNRQNHGLQKVALLRSLNALSFSKYLLCPLQPHWPPCSACFHPKLIC